MKRPDGVPEEFWHNEPCLAIFRAVEESAEFAQQMGVRWDEEAAYLPPDWRERVEKMLKRT